MLRYLFLWLLLFSVTFSYGQSPFFYKFNETNGFKSKSINAIAESEDGKIWIGTEGGLWCFDGFKFTHYKIADFDSHSLLSNNIQHLLIDKNQNLWIGYFQHGISVWNLKSGKRKNFHDFVETKELNTNRVMGFSVINEKIYAFFHDTAWLEFDGSKLTYKIVRPKINDFKPFLFRQIIYVPEHKKWFVATAAGMGEYFPEKNKVIGKPYKINNKPVFKIHNSINGLQYFNNNIWQNTWGGGLIKYDIKKDSFLGCYQYNTSEQFSGVTNNIFASIPYNDHEFLIATPDSALGWFNTQTNSFNFIDIKEFSSLTYASLIFKDSKSNYWIGTETGLYHYVTAYQGAEILKLPKSPNPVTERLNFNYFLIEYQNELVTGSINGMGIYFYNKANYELERIIKFPFQTNTKTFRSLQAFVHKGILYINSWSGLFTLNTKTEKWERFSFNGNDELKEGIFRCVRIKNNQLLLGFANGRVGWYNLENSAFKIWDSKSIKGEAATFKESQIYELVLDKNNNIVAVNDGGFAVFNLKTDKIIQFSSQINSKFSKFNDMSHIIEDNLGYLWLSSRTGGILKIDPNNQYKVFKIYDEEHGLPGNDISGASLDKEGNFWGIYSNVIFRIESKTNIISKWNMDNGIQYEPSSWGVINILNDQIFYGMLDNVIVLSKKKLLSQLKEKNSFFIDNISYETNSFNQYQIPKDFNLPFNKNSFVIKIGNKNSLLNKHNRLRYRIKNDQNWIFTNLNQDISITNLAPGAYNFEISYSNNLNNHWSSSKSLLKFTVKRPFYQRWWFILSVLSIISLAFYYFYKMKMQKSELKSNYERKLEELKLEALRSQMNPHFLFNSLNSINYYIVKNETDKASEYLKKFSKLIRTILNHSKNEKVSLQDELDINSLYIELEQMRFSQAFEFELQLKCNTALEQIIIPSMLLQPFIENAIWHGLMHQKEKGVLQINIIENEARNNINIEIIDNGVGREKALQFKSKTAKTQKSYGSEMTVERIKYYNSIQNEIKIDYNILDLMENEVPKGTKVSINIYNNNGTF